MGSGLVVTAILGVFVWVGRKNALIGSVAWLAQANRCLDVIH